MLFRACESVSSLCRACLKLREWQVSEGKGAGDSEGAPSKHIMLQTCLRLVSLESTSDKAVGCYCSMPMLDTPAIYSMAPTHHCVAEPMWTILHEEELNLSWTGITKAKALNVSVVPLEETPPYENDHNQSKRSKWTVLLQ